MESSSGKMENNDFQLCKGWHPIVDYLIRSMSVILLRWLTKHTIRIQRIFWISNQRNFLWWALNVSCSIPDVDRTVQYKFRKNMFQPGEPVPCYVVRHGPDTQSARNYLFWFQGRIVCEGFTKEVSACRWSWHNSYRAYSTGRKCWSCEFFSDWWSLLIPRNPRHR